VRRRTINEGTRIIFRAIGARRIVAIGVGLLALVALAAAALHELVPEPHRFVEAIARSHGADQSDDSDSSDSDDGSDGGSENSSERPPLFPGHEAASVDPIVDPQSLAARRLMAGWFTAHGTKPDDKAFAHWLQGQIPAPPPLQQRRAELAPLRTLAAERNESGLTAAEWFDANGDGSAWPDLAKRTAGNHDAIHKDELASVIEMADQVAGDLKDKLGQSSPYVLDPSLRRGKDVKRDGACPCSYPSSHAAVAAAAATYLGAVDRGHVPIYEGFRNQVDFSRLYVAGHVASDLAAGSLLGDAIGEYFLVTRQGLTAAQITAPPCRAISDAA